MRRICYAWLIVALLLVCPATFADTISVTGWITADADGDDYVRLNGIGLSIDLFTNGNGWRTREIPPCVLDAPCTANFYATGGFIGTWTYNGMTAHHANATMLVSPNPFIIPSGSDGPYTGIPVTWGGTVTLLREGDLAPMYDFSFSGVGTTLFDGVMNPGDTFSFYQASATVTGDATAVPEPGSVLLLGCGLLGFGARYLKRRRLARTTD